MWDEFKIIRFKCQREWCFKLFRNRRNMRQPTPDFIFVKSNKTPCPWNTNFSSSSSYFDLGETSVLFPSFCLMWSHIFRGRQKMDFTSMFLLTVFSNNLTLIIWDHILNYFYGPHDVSRGSHCIYRMQKNEKLKSQKNLSNKLNHNAPRCSHIILIMNRQDFKQNEFVFRWLVKRKIRRTERNPSHRIQYPSIRRARTGFTVPDSPTRQIQMVLPASSSRIGERIGLVADDEEIVPCSSHCVIVLMSGVRGLFKPTIEPRDIVECRAGN